MNQKQHPISVRQTAERAVVRDEQNRRIEYAATNPIKSVLKDLHTTLRGHDAEAVSASRAKYGSNKGTREKKKSLPPLLTRLPPSCSSWLLYPQPRTWFFRTFLCLEAHRRILTA